MVFFKLFSKRKPVTVRASYIDIPIKDGTPVSPYRFSIDTIPVTANGNTTGLAFLCVDFTRIESVFNSYIYALSR